jgi:hypothetical protein
MSSQVYPQFFLQQYDTNLNFLTFVIIMDEAQFIRYGIENFHNKHLWADENPYAILPSHQKQCFSINIWAGICGVNLCGSHVLPNRLKGRNYKAFLVNDLPDFLAHIPLIIH